MQDSSVSLDLIHQSRFETVQEVLAAIPHYRYQLEAFAQTQQLQGKIPTDQDYPTEVIALTPCRTDAPPLLLIGGMGPLAGLNSFEKACQIFQNQREIILYQACSVPSRVEVIQHAQIFAQDSCLQRQLVDILEVSIRDAVGLFHSQTTLIQVIVLCNAVHHFLPLVIQQLQQNYPDLASRLYWISLIESVVQYLQKKDLYHPLILSTSATQMSRVYTQPLQSVGINVQEPHPLLQQILMTSIYKGVKAFDQDYACASGTLFFRKLLERHPAFDCLIAGCSEIPCLLTWMQSRDSLLLQQLLGHIEIIDPVELALHRASEVLCTTEVSLV
jgi:aspartate racemase